MQTISKKTDMSYEKKKSDEQNTITQKSKDTIEYQEKILGKTAIKEYEHIKAIKQKKWNQIN